MPTELFQVIRASLLRHRGRVGVQTLRAGSLEDVDSLSIMEGTSPVHWVAKLFRDGEDKLAQERASQPKWQKTRPTRYQVSQVKCFQQRHLHIGRGVAGSCLEKSVWANPFRVSTFGRSEALQKIEQHIWANSMLMSEVPKLQDRVLLCHCAAEEE